MLITTVVPCLKDSTDPNFCLFLTFLLPAPVLSPILADKKSPLPATFPSDHQYTTSRLTSRETRQMTKNYRIRAAEESCHA